jgi:putative nucleotidyltransferase with HDIG domain
VTLLGTDFSGGSLIGGDTITSVTVTSAGAAAGATVDGSPYPIVPSAATGTGLSNYNITYVNGALTVNPKALTITADNRTKSYGTTLTFAGTEFGAVGLVNGDTVTSVTLASVGVVADAAADGSPYPIVPSGATGTGLSNYNISYVNGSLTVNKVAIGFKLDSSVTKSTKGHRVTFTATVTDSAATGTVTFQDGESILGSSDLIDGSATYTTSALSAGSHTITAIYSGDPNFAGSTSAALDLTIKPAAGLDWALIGAGFAIGALLGLFLLLLIFRRRRKNPAGTEVTAEEVEATVGVAGTNQGEGGPVDTTPLSPDIPAAGDTLPSAMALTAAEEVGTYSIQLERDLEKSIKRVEKSMEAGIRAVCRTVETKDPYVAAHQERVSQLACTMAKEMGLTAWQIDGVRVAGLLHDIGKITVPTEILSKPGKLSNVELAMIKDHPKVAFDILKNIEFDWPIARIVVQHHERLDGSGYPYGITGKDILLEAKILAVADVVEAMSSSRPYRPALGIEEALAELARGDGTLYDPDVVRACEKVINKRGFKVELSNLPA